MHVIVKHVHSVFSHQRYDIFRLLTWFCCSSLVLVPTKLHRALGTTIHFPYRSSCYTCHRLPPLGFTGLFPLKVLSKAGRCFSRSRYCWRIGYSWSNTPPWITDAHHILYPITQSAAVNLSPQMYCFPLR